MAAVSITHLLLVRHGESEWNAAGRWQGQADPPLTALGRHQAAVAGARIAALHAEAPFDIAIASDLQRALITASIIADHLALGTVTAMAELRERHAGSWQGLTRAEIDAQWPGAIAARQWPDGYEPDEDIMARLLPALAALAESRRGQRIVAVAHGGLIRALDRYLEAPEASMPNLAGRWYELDTPIRPGEHLELVPSDLEFSIE